MAAFVPLMGIDSGKITWDQDTSLENNLHTFAMNRSVALTDTTVTGMKSRRFSKGLTTSSGSFSILVNDTHILPDVGAEGTLVLFGGVTTRQTIECIIETLDVSWNIDGRVEASYGWRQSGTGVTGDWTSTIT